MIHTDEDDEFERIERENKIKGQPYHFQKREWVNLTDEELADCMDMSIQKTCRAIEAKLKEKNEKT
jgi:non-homologous end joining protein Ku